MIRALLALLILTIGALANAYTQEQETTYGPWKGRWTKARLSAYSPHDAIDREYHATKGERWRWITADGKTDVRKIPYGIAAPGHVPFGTRVFIPTGLGYLDKTLPGIHQRVIGVDDRGGLIQSQADDGERLQLDLRYRTEYSALAFGVKDAWVFIITGDNK